MISIHGPSAVSRRFEVLGTEDGQFILQGNLTLEQIKDLKDECEAVLKANKEA